MLEKKPIYVVVEVHVFNLLSTYVGILPPGVYFGCVAQDAPFTMFL